MNRNTLIALGIGSLAGMSLGQSRCGQRATSVWDVGQKRRREALGILAGAPLPLPPLHEGRVGTAWKLLRDGYALQLPEGRLKITELTHEDGNCICTTFDAEVFKGRSTRGVSLNDIVPDWHVSDDSGVAEVAEMLPGAIQYAKRWAAATR